MQVSLLFLLAYVSIFVTLFFNLPRRKRGIKQACKIALCIVLGLFGLVAVGITVGMVS